jgi:hypothetical protein
MFVVCDDVKKNHKLECLFVLFFIIMLLFLTHPHTVLSEMCVTDSVYICGTVESHRRYVG